jgi:hypothetical protein
VEQVRLVGPDSRAPTWTGAAAVVGIALLARALEAVLDPSVFNDGPRFVAMAAKFLAGDWRAALSDDFHPLTALSIAAWNRAFGLDLEVSGELSSVLAGGVAALAIYRLALEQLGSRAALVAGLIFALHPRLRESSAGVQSDGLHLAWFTLAALFAWRALEHRQWKAAALAGLCTGLAYLTRPEGLAIAVVLGGWLAVDLAQRRLTLGRAASLGAAYGLVLAAVSAPYVLALHEIGGRWSITHKKDLSAWVPAAPAASPPPATILPAGTTPAEIPPASEPAATESAAPPAPSLQATAPTTRSELRSELLRDGLRGIHPILLGLAALGLGVVARSELHARRAAAYGLSFLLLFVALLLALHLMAGYVSRRHFLPAAALLAPLAGRGTLALADGVSRRFPRLAAWRAGPALGLAIILGILVEMLVPKSEPSRVAREEAARWLGEHHAPTAVASHRARDAYYAGAARHVPLEEHRNHSLEAMLRSVQTLGASFAILDVHAGSDPDLPAWAHVVHREKYRDAEVLVVELGP